MRPRHVTASSLLLCTLSAAPAFALPHIHRGPTAPRVVHTRPSPRTHAAVGIDPARAAEIQNALVHAGYLTSASGAWDGETITAMQKLQADNGWQTKLVPDARAIIKLGLGPGANAGSSVVAADPVEASEPVTATPDAVRSVPANQ